MVKFAIFKNLYNTSGDIVEHSFREFYNKYLAKPEIQAVKNNNRLYSFAAYRDDIPQRAEYNIVGVYGAVLDIDNTTGPGGEVSDDITMPEDHIDNLAGFEWAYHSTFKSRKGAERWRLLMPFTRMVTPDEWPHVYAGVLALLGNDPNIDRTCSEISRAYFFPGCPAEYIQDSFSGFMDGEQVDPDYLKSLVDFDAMPGMGSQQENVVTFDFSSQRERQQEQHQIKNNQDANNQQFAGRNDHLKAQMAACLAKGKSIDQTVRELIQFDSLHHNPPLFNDPSENMRADPYTNALQFVSNNLKSINSRRMAQGQAPEVPGGVTGPEPVKPLPLVPLSDIAAILDTVDIVDDVLLAGQMSVIYGHSNVGKSFMVLDMGLCVATGLPWHGRNVDPGPVIYFAAEASKSIYNRIQAWKEVHKPTDNTPFYVVPVGVDLLDPLADKARILEAIEKVTEAHGRGPVLIIIDTLARVMGGGNENSGQDMGALVSNADDIREACGAHILFVHHSGKDEAKGARGHSSLRAATDTEIELKKNGEFVSAFATKQREIIGGPVLDFKLNVHTLGINNKGKKVASCTISPINPTDKLSDKNKQAFNILMQSVTFGHVTRVNIQNFRKELSEKGVTEGSKPGTERKQWERIAKAIESIEFITKDNGEYVIKRDSVT